MSHQRNPVVPSPLAVAIAAVLYGGVALVPPVVRAEDLNVLQEVVVTGSRIPRTSLEGPAPVVTISADDILKNGFGNVSDIMTALTQNLGALDNNQYTNGFSPGAQAVDLRGLGPNHTLVLVNGRRVNIPSYTVRPGDEIQIRGERSAPP